MAERRCEACSGPLPPDSTVRRRYCSDACKWLKRPRIPCEACGRPTGWVAGSKTQSATHPACRPVEHGSSTMYQSRGCRCTECRAWKAASMRAYSRARRSQGRPIPKQNQPAHAVRLAVYERDAWICQLCGDPVDATADPNSDWYPSIDHIVPVSLGSPDHSMDNLRTTHRWCNCIRGAAKHDDIAFRTAT